MIGDRSLSKISGDGGKRYIPARSNGSARALAWIEQQLSYCRNKDIDCTESQEASFVGIPFVLPKRLLDVSHAINGQLVTLKDSKDIADSRASNRPSYMTFSHRWGADPGLELNSSTRHMLYAGLPIDKLPPLFRDCARLVAKLGCSYIWIDSMCIQQDDEGDWLEQASQMIGIYTFSELNVCASWSLSQDSLHIERSPLKMTDCIIRPKWTCFPTDALRIDRDMNWKHVNHCDLVKRGWVFQERLLAPRVVHFTNQHLMWECRTRYATEPDFQETPKTSMGTFRSSPQDLALILPPIRSTPTKVLEFWLSLLGECSSKLTTFEKDRLFAVAGIAGIFKMAIFKLAQIEVTYHAGLWDFEFVRQMVWYAVRTRSTGLTCRPKIYLAPTWS